MRPRSLLLSGLLALLALPVSVRAQEVSAEAAARVSTEAPTPAAAIRAGIASPSFSPARLLEAVEEVPLSDAGGPVLPVAPQARSKRGTTYMIAGGAAFVGGLIIGGDAGTAIAVGGLGLGIYGFFLYR